MSRRVSGQPSTSLAAKKNDNRRRTSSKDSSQFGFIRLPSAAEPLPIKEGDIYYKTTRWYPSVVGEENEEVYISITRADGAPVARSFPRSAGKEHRESVERSDSRRGSVMSDKARDEAISTPSPGDDHSKPEHRHDKDDNKTRAASIAGAGRQKLNIWPEFNDNDINAEKWGSGAAVKDAAHKGKKEDKGKSPVVQHFFEDPEGKIELPPCLKVDHWKRPHDFIFDKTPTVVDQEAGMHVFDLLQANEHITHSELMRWIVSEVSALWRMHETKPTGSQLDNAELGLGPDDMLHTWKPWEHIYAINKVGKGPYIPAYNSHGKYAVRVWWLGCWRKVIVDDLMPFNEENQMLLPASTLQHELWPMLLTKALVKVASLDYNGGNSSCEFGDFSPIHCLTGWLPETIPLQYGHVNEIWNLLKQVVPEFKLPEVPPPEAAGEVPETPAEPQNGDVKDGDGKEAAAAPKESRIDFAKSDGKDGKSTAGGAKGKGKDGKDDKGKDKGKEKDKNKEKLASPETEQVASNPEIVVFASYQGTPKLPLRVSILAEMADASERLRQAGLSHLFPHPVWMTQTRSCPLEPPPPPEKIPAWKLIRPKKKKQIPSGEPRAEPDPPKPIQCVEITSPFVNYKVSPIPIPTDIHRPKSSLERGSTHSRPATAANIEVVEETDENAPEPEVTEEAKPSTPPPAEPVKEEESLKVEELKAAKPGTPQKDGKKKGSAASSKKEKDKEETQPPAKVDKKSAKNEKDKLDVKSADRKKSMTGKDRADSVKTVSKPDIKDKSVAGKESAVDVPTMANSEEELGEEEQTPEEQVEITPAKPVNLWMDWDIFCKCFNTLIIYHKPNTYPNRTPQSDLKNVVSSSKGDKKSAASGAMSVMYSDQAPHYLFVDNLKPTEIVVSFSSFSRWFDPPPIPSNPKESHTSVKSKDKEDVSLSNVSQNEALSPTREPPPPPVQSGLLVAEPYSWKSLITGQPILRLRSTATRAAVLSLPEGRHVLRFTMTAPYGYHVLLCSTVPFVFGMEEEVMSHLTKESCRFVDNATQVIRKIGDCIKNFSDTALFKQSFEDLTNCHCPYRSDKLMSKVYHFKLFNDSLYHTLRKALVGELATAEMAFAWRALNFDVTTPNILALQTGSRPATGATSHRGSAKPGKGKRSDHHHDNQMGDVTDKTLEKWIDREPTPEEHVAAVKIQRNWRLLYVRRIVEARTPGTDIHNKVVETLQKAWAVLEPQAEQHGLQLFRTLFKHDPELMSKYPFHKDEWNKISYADYSGSYPDQPANTWFIVFREIFYVSEEMLAVPKLLNVPINTCLLRVVNNDNGEEIPRVFQKVAPYVYKRNKKGYTFVAEARTTDTALQGGKWRMRLIGSLSPLPAPIRTEVTSTFHQREIRDHYLPNEKNIIFRYTVRVTEDHLGSIQINTSKSDVYIRLSILDHEEELLSTVGKGHAVLSSFIFQKDYNPEEDKRASSRSSMHAKSKMTSNAQAGKKTARIGSAKSLEGSRPASHVSGDLPMETEEEERDTRPHKYIIQATVLRNSWPLSQTAWAFVQDLKELEKNELKRDYRPESAHSVNIVANKDRPPSSSQAAKLQAQAASKKGAKSKDKKDHKKEGSRPPSQAFDLSKPHWTLRFVSDANQSEEVEVRKDTERADEIRAMKRAWEDAEPGRAAKALQSRQKYLNTHMIKVNPETADEAPVAAESIEPIEGTATPFSSADVDGETVLTLEPPPPPPPKEILQPLDITPFLSKTTDTPRYRDETVIREQMEAKQREINEYRAFREEVEAWREQDRLARNLLKVKQIEMCEEMQARLDQKRKEINEPREAFRQKFLEAERIRLEEIAAAEAALRAEQEKNAPSPKGRKSAKGKKGSAGKKKK